MTDEDEYVMRDPMIKWRADGEASDRERRRETVRRKMAERAMTREAQAAVALPAHLRELEDRLRKDFAEQLVETLRAVSAAVNAVERGFDRLTAKLDRLEAKQHESAMVSAAASTAERRANGGLN
jgi:hypothetical protein